MRQFKAKLPPGYDVVAGGTVEDSAKAEASIFAVFPLMLLVMITILMVQLQSFQRLLLVLATAPLALIGVAAALLISGAPMGFVAILGIVSLVGMVIRNSVILIDQIETEIANGEPAWDAVIAATEHRLRPILLTAAAAILGMIPIAPTVFWGRCTTVFWGPMAYAVMGGLVVATLLTLVFLPALYVAWFRIQPVEAPSRANVGDEGAAVSPLYRTFAESHKKHIAMNAQSDLRANPENRTCFHLILSCINEGPGPPDWCGNLMVRKARPPLITAGVTFAARQYQANGRRRRTQWKPFPP